MAYIFLSYAKADRKTALVMRDVLQKEGFSVWMDENRQQLPEKQWPQVVAIIKNAAAFVLLVSDAAQKSAWLKRELDTAEKSQKAILPILIQGKGWSRLQMPMTSLGLSINLSLPESFVAELKSVVPSDEIPLPEQIIIQTVEQRVRLQQRWLTIFVFVLVISAAIASFVFGQIEGNRAPSHAERVLTNEAERRVTPTATVNRREATRDIPSADRTATQISWEATRVSYIASQTSAASTRSAVREDEYAATREANLEASQTQSVFDSTATEAQNQVNATTVSISSTQQAILRVELDARATVNAASTATSVSIMTTHEAILSVALDATATVNAASTATSVSITSTQWAILRVELDATATVNAQANMLATENYDANMSMTAAAGNGVLPCTATVPLQDNLYVLTVYRSPSLSIVPSARSERSEINLIVHEWIVNDDGVWYRVGTEQNSYIGYMLAESLILDELCPR